MKKLKVLLLLLAIMNLYSCKKTNSSNDDDQAYSDGTYCADVTYYNPTTGTNNTYSLNVEVVDNQLTVIQWPNGGWLDDSHFTPAELDGSGNCSFTSDQGYKYNIQITGSECSFTDDVTEQSEEVVITCLNCGGEKDEFSPYCKKCNDDIENTCSRCGGFEYYVYGGLCTSCKSSDKNY